MAAARAFTTDAETVALQGEVDRALGRVLRAHRLGRLCRRAGLAGIHRDLSEFVRRKGKRIRPLLFLSTYRALNGGRPLPMRALGRAAAALEIFHAFILAHDDIIDRSAMRRGRPTLHRMVEARLAGARDGPRQGENVALVLGDLLFALATELIFESGLPPARRDALVREFLDGVWNTGVGEILDVLNAGREVRAVEPCSIELTYYLKTTKYTFEGPMVWGALLAGASAGVVDELRCFAYPMGLAFQIENDLLEIEDAASGGKVLAEDLAEGRKTLLLRAAYDRVGKADRVFLQACFDAQRLPGEAIERIRHLVIRSGAFREMRGYAHQLLEDARRTLRRAGLTPPQQLAMRGVLEHMRSAILPGRGRA
jgi:geranylgeranyl diphosphate synthase type I